MDIQAFQGWRYNVAAGEDVGSLIAPPYDILNAADKQALLASQANNIVAVDLPHVPPKELGPDGEYQAAASLLEHWQSSGVLTQETTPALYAYEQTFTWGTRTYSRRALLAGVRATQLGKDVIPHEHTFAGPKADRLRLTELTQTQLSPIFGFYDGAPEAFEALWAAAASKPDLAGVLNGVTEKLWVVSDPRTIEAVRSSLKAVPVFIADGHHRYTTALNYRDQLQAAGIIGPDHQANFVLFALVPRNDPGLLILPTHRVIRGLKKDFIVDQLIQAAPEFRWQRVAIQDADMADADGWLKAFGRWSFGLIGADKGSSYVATLVDRAAMDLAAPDELPVWRDLDVAILHKLLVDKALCAFKTDQFAIEYTPSGPAVIQACQQDAQLGICLQSTPLKAVQEIALAGASMPHKSTYFYPKLATGLVLKPLR